MPQHQHQQQHEPTPGMLKAFYNKHSSAQGSVVRTCRPLLQRAAAEAPLGEDNCLRIAEWGCAHGGNSIEPVLLICTELQQRLQQLPANNRSHCRPLQVHVAHTDVPSNDWQGLFDCAQQYAQQAQSNCPELHVTFSAIGASMYHRNHPCGTIDIGFAFSTLHWQSKKAVLLKHTVIPCGDKVLPEERAVLRAHALSDFKTFLLLRAEEFRPGGMLVLGHISCHDAPEAAEDPSQSWAVTYHKPLQGAVEQMVAEGLLQEEELGLMALPVFFMDTAQQMQVYQDVADSWELLHLEEHKGCSPVTTAWRAGEATNEELAQANVNFFRAVATPCFEAALKAAGREQGVVDSLLEQLYARLYTAACASSVPVEFPFTAVLLRRRG